MDKTVNVWQVLTLLGVLATGIRWGDQQLDRITLLEHEIQELKFHVAEISTDIKALVARH